MSSFCLNSASYVDLFPSTVRIIQWYQALLIFDCKAVFVRRDVDRRLKLCKSELCEGESGKCRSCQRQAAYHPLEDDEHHGAGTQYDNMLVYFESFLLRRTRSLEL